MRRNPQFVAPWICAQIGIATSRTANVHGRVGYYASWLSLAMTLISALNAVLRKFLNLSSNAFLEIQWYRIAEAPLSNFMAGQRLPYK